MGENLISRHIRSGFHCTLNRIYFSSCQIVQTFYSLKHTEHELIMECDANEVVASDSQSEFRADTAALGDDHNGSGSQRSHLVKLKQLYRPLEKMLATS